VSGQFIVLEGADGVGKTTQTALLSSWLESREIEHVVAREPGGTPLGEAVRDLILRETDLHIAPEPELLLILASRAAFVSEVVKPALAAGNTIVMKPSEVTSLSILHWIEIAGGDMPAGVMNVVTGLGGEAGEALVKHPDVPILTFTGSVRTGKRIARLAADNLKKVSLELGGKDPVIVCDDADIEVAAKGSAWGGFLNSGQVCTSVERVYVFDSIADKFTEALVEEAKKVKLGDPFDKGTDVGPMSSKMQLSNTINKVDLAKKEGARVLTGGKQSDQFEKGYFYEPTVFDQVTPNMEIIMEEAFSPVIPVQRVKSLDEAITMSNSTRYGLGCSIFTRDIERALTAADNIQAGTFCINSPLMENMAAPFGGMKQSGIGREHGLEALEEFREAKHIFIDYDHSNKDWWFGNEE